MNAQVPDNDPASLLLLFEVESRIVRCNREVRAAGIEINDSQVRLILTKVRTILEGGTPKLPDASERDRLLLSLHAGIVGLEAAPLLGGEVGKPSILPIGAWIAAVRQVEDSIRRRSTGSGSRAYLEFVEAFMARELGS